MTETEKTSDNVVLPIPPEVIKAISGIEKPTVGQQLIIDELTQTSTPELGPILARELADTVGK